MPGKAWKAIRKNKSKQKNTKFWVPFFIAEKVMKKCCRCLNTDDNSTVCDFFSLNIHGNSFFGSSLVRMVDIGIGNNVITDIVWSDEYFPIVNSVKCTLLTRFRGYSTAIR